MGILVEHTLLHALRRLDFPTLGRPIIAICKIVIENYVVLIISSKQGNIKKKSIFGQPAKQLDVL